MSCLYILLQIPGGIVEMSDRGHVMRERVITSSSSICAFPTPRSSTKPREKHRKLTTDLACLVNFLNINQRKIRRVNAVRLTLNKTPSLAFVVAQKFGKIV